MSYPEELYRGSTGDVSATYRPADRRADLTIGSAVALSYLATGASTAGRFGLYRWDAGPQSGGAAPHFHRTMSESFFVVSGRVELYDGKQWVDAGPGDFVYVPEGGLHGFRNQSDEPASMLILFAPGAPRERYFEGLAELAQMAERPSAEEMAEFYREHDTYWV